MKQVEKEIPHVERRTVYQAWDGEEFDAKEECLRYEKSAASVVMARLEDCLIAKDYNAEIFDCGDENKFKTIVPQTEEDINSLNHLYFMFGGSSKEDPYFSYDEIDTPIIIGYRIIGYNYDWVWFYKLKDIVKDLTDGKYKLVESEETENK
jgi:hypothetical protein